MNTAGSNIQTIRQKVRPIAERHGLAEMYLFGSRARGDNRPDSDYDFLISKGKVKDLLLLAALVDDLETTLNAHVDVLTDTSDDAGLIAEAREEAVLLYEQARNRGAAGAGRAAHQRIIPSTMKEGART